MQSIKAGKLITLFKISVFIMIVSCAPDVYAEYYIVYPAPNPVFACPNCYVRETVWRPHRVHHHAAKHHRCGYYRHYRNYAYDIRCVVPACGGCMPPPPPCMSCARSPDFVQFNWNPGAYGHGRYVRIDEFDTNDPDLSTGDDDASIHP